MLSPAQQNKTSVHQLGLDLWRDCVVRNRRIRERLLDMLLGMVQVRWGSQAVGVWGVCWHAVHVLPLLLQLRCCRCCGET